MALLRYFSVCILGIACVRNAHAQSTTTLKLDPPYAQTAPMRIPPISAEKGFITITPALQPAIPTLIPKLTKPAQIIIKPEQIAQNDAVCYTIRSYGFNAHDLESSAPKPSSASNCTPRTATLFKGAGIPDAR